MFETATLTYGSGSKRVWGTFAGMTGQILLVTCAVLAPMISPSVLPRATWIDGLAAPGPPQPPPPNLPAIRPNPGHVLRTLHELITPGWIPPTPRIIIDPVETVPANSEPGVPGGIAQGRGGGVVGSPFLESILSSVRPPVPVVRPPEPVATAPPVKVPATVKPPRISALELAHPISRGEPAYPVLARQMRVSGVVELRGVLGTDGRIHELRVLSGHPLLVKAAVDAVLRWVYAPTVLNGQAVEVEAPILVTFRLKE